MADVQMRLLLSAVGGAGVTSMVGQVASSLKGGLGGALLAVGAAAAGTAIAIGVHAVNAAATFQSGMTSLVTGAGEAQSAIGMVSDGVLKMAVDTGTSTAQLTSGMYLIESAGYHGASGLRVLQTAAEGAKVGNADLGTVADALTTTLTDYHLKASDAASVMNALTATVSSGKMHLQDLAGSMGSILPLASSLHVSFPQVAGALATMTNSGMDAQRASMDLANAIRALSAPSGTADKAMASVGLTARQLKNTLSTQGLSGAIQLVSEHIGKKFPANSVQAVEAFKSIMGGATGYNVALMLGGKNMQTFTGNVKNVSSALSNGKGNVTGWNLVTRDFAFKMDQAREAGEAFMIKLGTALIPIVTQAMTGIQNLSAWVGTAIGNFVAWLQKSGILQGALDLVRGAVQNLWNIVQGAITVVQNIYGWFVQWHEPILIVAGAITLFFLPAIIKAGVEAVIAGGKIGAGFVANLIQTGAQAIVNGAKLTISFIASMIQAGAQAIVNGAKITVSFIAALIQTGLQGWAAAGKLGIFIGQLLATGAKAAWSATVIAGKFIWGLIQSGIEAGKTAAVFLTKMIPALLSMAADGIVAVVGAMPGMIGGLIGATGAAWGFTASLLANPITWIVLGIMALIGVVILLATHWKEVSAFLTMIWGHIVAFWNDDVVKPFHDGLSKLGQIASNIFGGIASIVKGAVNHIIDGINSFIGFIDSIQIHIPAIGVGPVTTPAFDWNGLGIPKIPHMARGGTVTLGGLSVVGEQGPELLNLPRGAQVVPLGAGAGQTRVQGGHTFNIYLSTMARSQSEVSRLVDLLEQELGRRVRLQTPGYNTGGVF